ncbi:RCC1 and BTB domain-containing protein [Nesidiocoris tenuis]|uniref:RCC1 and BTB domain-containing protein n=1 Tax=Nesidiocoris tenuis TaxID=355587 RepID=A0ABN7A6M6_9HEMI|nr:RCC1 and BTB domain-containing protein [Nesidiocoris tenuis]
MEDKNYVGLKDWDLFKNVDLNILTQIRLCHIFSETRTLLGAIYIDYQDKVFARGYNGKHCKLGLPCATIVGNVPETRIPELTNENITTIATGYRHGAALSENGNVFFWGLDLSCSDSQPDKVTQRPKIMNEKLQFMKGEFGKQIACSGNALAVITQRSRLLVWGFVDGSAPASYIAGEVVLGPSAMPKSVVGGGWHFAVVTTTRQLYTFGNGSSGALGYEWDIDRDDFKTPRKVKGLPEEPIGHVACSQSATLVYLQPWSLFIFGANSLGELGLQSSVKDASVFVPTRINLSEAIQTVYASLYNSIFYATTANPKRTFRWGYDTTRLKPQIIESKTPISCFANRALPIHATDSTSAAGSAPTLFAESDSNVGQLQELCDENLFSDLTIRFRDGTTFKAHRSVLYTRSEHFKIMLQPSHFAEGQATELDMSAYDPNAYRTYLRYVYKGCVDAVSTETLVHLFMIADEYMETALRDHCFEKFTSLINVSSVGQLYQVTKFCGCPQLSTECYAFAMENLDALIEDVKQRNLQGFLESLLSF